jgi:hypothetical protein
MHLTWGGGSQEEVAIELCSYELGGGLLQSGLWHRCAGTTF